VGHPVRPWTPAVEACRMQGSQSCQWHPVCWGGRCGCIPRLRRAGAGCGSSQSMTASTPAPPHAPPRRPFPCSSTASTTTRCLTPLRRHLHAAACDPLLLTAAPFTPHIVAAGCPWSWPGIPGRPARQGKARQPVQADLPRAAARLLPPPDP
jgi:hypothetical protein